MVMTIMVIVMYMMILLAMLMVIAIFHMMMLMERRDSVDRQSDLSGCDCDYRAYDDGDDGDCYAHGDEAHVSIVMISVMIMVAMPMMVGTVMMTFLPMRGLCGTIVMTRIDMIMRVKVWRIVVCRHNHHPCAFQHCLPEKRCLSS